MKIKEVIEKYKERTQSEALRSLIIKGLDGDSQSIKIFCEYLRQNPSPSFLKGEEFQKLLSWYACEKAKQANTLTDEQRKINRKETMKKYMKKYRARKKESSND